MKVDGRARALSRAGAIDAVARTVSHAVRPKGPLAWGWFELVSVVTGSTSVTLTSPLIARDVIVYVHGQDGNTAIGSVTMTGFTFLKAIERQQTYPTGTCACAIFIGRPTSGSVDGVGSVASYSGAPTGSGAVALHLRRRAGAVGVSRATNTGVVDGRTYSITVPSPSAMLLPGGIVVSAGRVDGTTGTMSGSGTGWTLAGVATCLSVGYFQPPRDQAIAAPASWVASASVNDQWGGCSVAMG